MAPYLVIVIRISQVDSSNSVFSSLRIAAPDNESNYRLRSSSSPLTHLLFLSCAALRISITFYQQSLWINLGIKIEEDTRSGEMSTSLRRIFWKVFTDGKQSFINGSIDSARRQTDSKTSFEVFNSGIVSDYRMDLKRKKSAEEKNKKLDRLSSPGTCTS